MKARPKKCRVCKSKFEPFNSMQIVCGVKCAADYAREQKRKEWDRETRRRKKKLREGDRNWQLARLQEDFNAYIRLRDEDQPCISCGRWDSEVETYTGGKWDAGHFLSRGAYPELRFEELNCHKQCKTCNGGSGRFSHKARTVAAQYEERLIERIGQAAVDWLKGPHKPKKYTLEQVKEMRAEYRAKVRELKRKTEAA